MNRNEPVFKLFRAGHETVLYETFDTGRSEKVGTVSFGTKTRAGRGVVIVGTIGVLPVLIVTPDPYTITRKPRRTFVGLSHATTEMWWERVPLHPIRPTYRLFREPGILLAETTSSGTFKFSTNVTREERLAAMLTHGAGIPQQSTDRSLDELLRA